MKRKLTRQDYEVIKHCKTYTWLGREEDYNYTPWSSVRTDCYFNTLASHTCDYCDLRDGISCLSSYTCKMLQGLE